MQKIPFSAAQSEFTEKRSRFIGQVWPVSSEEEAQERIRSAKKKYHDARHNCWCYILGDTVLRYSDDGEPQGTAGQPMLNVFQREGVGNVCCVVTRYFGGILLGAGGLTPMARPPGTPFLPPESPPCSCGAGGSFTAIIASWSG